MAMPGNAAEQHLQRDALRSGFSVQTTTPQADGSLVHVVKSGENLWSISVAYGVYIQDIQRLNNMPDTQENIFIGQKLFIPTRLPTPITPTAASTQTPLPIVNQVVSTAASIAATSTAIAKISIRENPTPTISQTNSSSQPIPLTGNDPTQVVQTALIILAILGIALIVFGLAVK